MFPRYINMVLACCMIVIFITGGFLLFSGFPKERHMEKVPVCGNALQSKGVMVVNGTDTTYIDGKQVFQVNCAACHSPLRDATGPALKNVMPHRSDEWICRFITDSDFHPTDERAEHLRAQYERECIKLPQLSCGEIKAVVAYIGID